MSYPQAMDLLNFSDSEFDNCDYKVLQTGCVGIFVIGAIFTQHGLISNPNFNVHIVPKIIGNDSISIPISPITFSIVTGLCRITILPILLIIVILTFGSGDIMITTLCVAFIIIDVILGIITLILVRKYRNQEFQSIKNAKNE